MFTKRPVKNIPSQNLERAQVPVMGEWLNKWWHFCNGILLSNKNGQIPNTSVAVGEHYTRNIILSAGRLTQNSTYRVSHPSEIPEQAELFYGDTSTTDASGEAGMGFD